MKIPGSVTVERSLESNANLGFAKVVLKPGQTQKLGVPLDTRALAYDEVNQKQWRASAGDYKVLGGSRRTRSI